MTLSMPATRGTVLCSVPSGTLSPLSASNMSLASVTTVASDVLEQNPPDLVCPITHEIFSEPVINGAGQVYERSAIELHMRRSTVDPVTRMQLHPSSGLTPVWIVKSRSVRLKTMNRQSKIQQSCTCSNYLVAISAEP